MEESEAGPFGRGRGATRAEEISGGPLGGKCADGGAIRPHGMGPLWLLGTTGADGGAIRPQGGGPFWLLGTTNVND
jgi:hypothetical protein